MIDLDTPAQRMIKVGKASIGLIGLDTALNKALTDKLTPDEAKDFIFNAVRGSNYIPAGMDLVYKKAIAREYRKLLGLDDEEEQGLTIRILGPGCVSCNKIHTMVIDAMMRAGVAADIEQIHDMDEIWRHGVTATPALIINNKIKSAGIHPTLAQLEEWIREAAGEQR